MAARKPTADSLEVFDLDANRAQRYEGKADFFSFKSDGRTYTIPFEIKKSVFNKLSKLADADLDGQLSLLLGDQAEAFLDVDPSLKDILAVVEAYWTASGVSVPKDNG